MSKKDVIVKKHNRSIPDGIKENNPSSGGKAPKVIPVKPYKRRTPSK